MLAGIALAAAAQQEKLSFQNLAFPNEIRGWTDASTKQVVFLYGVLCVGGCPIGNYILEKNNRLDIIFVVPPAFTEDDIANLRRGMFVQANIYTASEATTDFLKKLSDVMKLKDWANNFVLEIEDGKINNVKLY
jgi:hypothetical protein